MAKGKRSVALFEVIQSSKSAQRESMMRTPSWWFKRRGAEGSQQKPALDSTSDLGSSAPAPRAPGVDLRVDGDRQRISLNLSYTTALVTGFAVIVVLGLAILIGQRISRGPTQALAGPSTEEIKKLPAKPDVLNITQAPRPRPQQADRPAGAPAAPTPPPAQLTAPTTSPSGTRVLGLNYVLVQSFAADKKMADDACKLLNDNGIPCTVETGVPGWTGAYCVIGLRGFQRVSGPEFDTYVRSIRDLNEKIPRTAKWQRFEPTGIAGKLFIKPPTPG